MSSLHEQCVPAASAELAVSLAPIAEASELLLGGGTACALMLGHRVSRDLDFFALHTLEPRALLDELTEIGDCRLRGISAAELHVSLGEVDVFATALGRDTLGPPELWLGLSVLHPLDLAELKVVAATRRGMSRDLCDLHLLCESGVELEAAIRASPIDLVVALKALTDAERFRGQPALDLRVDWTVDAAVAYFEDQARRLLIRQA